MSDYTVTTNFAAKDALPTGDPNKVATGTSVDTEFDNIATAVATKANKISGGTANNVVEQDANGDLVDTGLATPTGAFVGTSDTQTLTNKTVDLTNNTLQGTTAEFNTALEDGSFCTLAGTETLTNKTLTSPVLNTGVSGTAVLDEDDMASNSATKLATQQSIKAYVDASIPAHRGALVYRTTATQSIANDTLTNLGLDGESYDTDTIHDPSTNNSRLSVPSGVTKVRLTGQCRFAPDGTGKRQLTLIKNGSGAYVGQPISEEVGDGTYGNILKFTSPILEVVGGTDYFEMEVYQNSGGALNVSTNNGYTWFEMEIIE